jgi:hypothetical protein
MSDRSPARRRPIPWLAAVGLPAITASTALLAVAAHGQTAYMVRDLGPADSEARIEVQSFFPLGDRLLFSGGYLSGPYLWVSDGTASGTQPLSSPCRVACDGLSFLGGAGGLAYFVPSGGHSSSELWRTDGTRAGRIRLLRGAQRERPDRALWASDGTAARTSSTP